MRIGIGLRPGWWRPVTGFPSPYASQLAAVCRPRGLTGSPRQRDLLAAGVMNATRWPAELERRLNANPEWGRRAGGRRTRVINTARDGIGAIQFRTVFEHDARRFDPDLVVVSLILDDLRRLPVTRGL